MIDDAGLLFASLGYKLAVAVLAYMAIAAVDWWWSKRKRGAFNRHLLGADPVACAIYLGLRRLAAAVLIGLAIG